MAKNSLNIPTWLEKIFKFAYLKWKVFCKNFSLTFPDFSTKIFQIPWLSLTFPDFAEKDTFFADFQHSMNHVKYMKAGLFIYHVVLKNQPCEIL